MRSRNKQAARSPGSSSLSISASLCMMFSLFLVLTALARTSAQCQIEAFIAGADVEGNTYNIFAIYLII